MISANELRIGNFIEANGPMMEVKSIYDDHVELYLHGSEADNWDEDLEACNGIPLTPEILEKCGFELRIEDTIEKDYKLYPLFVKFQHNGSLLVTIHEYSSCSHIKYLHQLQNVIFALTNTELNYKP